VGNGLAGNVGAQAIAHLVLRDKKLEGVSLTPWNPMPAQGGMSPEPMAEVKLLAPTAFRQHLQRAITADDYARLVEHDFHDQVQRVAARLRRAGSWYEVVVAVDQRGRLEADPALLKQIQRRLRRYRRIGHDVRVVSAIQVPLDVKLVICVLPGYLRGHVKAELLELFSNRRLPDGRLGLFHADNLTFGEGIYLSKLIALARSVQGVENVVVERLERYGEPSGQAIIDGVLALSPYEVARLDSDPNARENGRLELDLRGGR
jgi:predicted phage baseplate assembly protein